MNQGSHNPPSLYLYEPRMLLRTIIGSAIDPKYLNFQLAPTLADLIRNVAEDTAKNKIILAGIAGAGPALPELLRFIRNAKALKIKTLLWAPAGYPWVFRLLSALHTPKVLSEDDLVDELIPALNMLSRMNPLLNRNIGQGARARRITLTELDILLQFSAGLSSKEMANSRQCSYKTIFSWKHNICEALSIDTHAQWLEMLSEIVQLSSMYQADKRYGAF